MTDISLETVTGKLNRLGYDAFIQALRQAKGAGNANLELAHWFLHVLQKDRSDLALTCDHYKLDRGRLLTDLQGVVDGFKKNVTEMPQVSEQIIDALDRGWHYATLFFGEMQIRTGHVLMGMLKDMKLNRALKNLSAEFGKLNADALAGEYRTIWADSDEETLRPMDGSAIGAPRHGRGAGADRHDRARQVLRRLHRQGGRRWTRSSAATRRSARSSTSCCAAGRTTRS